MMGWIGTKELAAHGIVLEITAMAFMVHLGLSNAATIRTGHAFGSHDARGLRDGARVVIGISALFALIVIATFLITPRPLIALFLDPAAIEAPQILAFGVTLMAISALFQVADAMQVIALGLLRGIHDTRIPMIAAAISYWGIGMPAAYALAFWAGLGGVGLWLGLTLGLACAAVTLMWRFWAKVPKAV